MFRCIAYTESMKDEWDRLALTQGTVFHSTAFRKLLLRSFGYQCAYHAIMDKDDRICAMIPLVVGRNLGLKRVAVSLPFVNYTDICAVSSDAMAFAIEAIAALKAKLGLSYVELRFKAQRISRPDWREQLQNHTFVLPLSSNEEEVLSRSSSSNRNHVRKVYKNHCFRVSFDLRHLDAFYKVYVRRMKQLGSPAPDIRFFKRFFELLPDHAALLTVQDSVTSATVGGMLLLKSPGNSTLYYPYGANLVEYNNKYLNNFMYWEAVRYGIRSGCQYLDLGRSQTGSGTYKYKEQWGAEAKQLQYLIYDGGQAAAAPPDKQSLSFFIELWKAAPSFVTNQAGKRLIRFLMP
ncbi:GNAT family N-acetyltransferase [Paenibacillus cremeus]|uniref:GNAT family N-acetyltransferase n=1 Tax=Paenibacillus cremeus TaxID=2163881 RepID=A0A559KD70_9BACL|nr:GNAT family N-acetyltransferase [Paenibacillus cremeus]TVY10080.1 GNAT family N-acetyltransferase [Paenibacillus cremeus]